MHTHHTCLNSACAGWLCVYVCVYVQAVGAKCVLLIPNTGQNWNHMVRAHRSCPGRWCVCVHVCMCMYVCMYVCMYECVYVCMSVCVVGGVGTSYKRLQIATCNCPPHVRHHYSAHPRRKCSLCFTRTVGRASLKPPGPMTNSGSLLQTPPTTTTTTYTHQHTPNPNPNPNMCMPKPSP